MNFRTELILPHAPFTVKHGERIFMAGSCFAENIHVRLHGAKFDAVSNPTGILFNPMSIARMFGLLSGVKEFSRDDLTMGGDSRWFSWQHHGSFSDTDPEAALEKMNAALREGRLALRAAEYVVITFGTAWIYNLCATGETVANCHKMPAATFERRRMTIDSIVGIYIELLNGVLKDKKVVFTVSPVRHLKDGFEENSLSKAILRAAVGQLTENHGNAFYFPAFELLNDDLRDYRFYAEDMVHPSSQAVDYVWEKFSEWAFGERALRLLPRLEKLTAATRHRIQDHGSAETVGFAENMLRQVAAMEKELPEADFSPEREYFRSLL